MFNHRLLYRFDVTIVFKVQFSNDHRLEEFPFIEIKMYFSFTKNRDSPKVPKKLAIRLFL